MESEVGKYSVHARGKLEEVGQRWLALQQGLKKFDEALDVLDMRVCGGEVIVAGMEELYPSYDGKPAVPHMG